MRQSSGSSSPHLLVPSAVLRLLPASSRLLFSLSLSLSLVLHSMDRSSGSYGGTHAKRRHVTGIRIVDDRWRFLPLPLDRIVASNCFGGARDTVHWPTQIWSLSSLEGPTWTWTGYLRFQACEPLFPRDDHEVSRFRPLVYTISR